MWERIGNAMGKLTAIGVRNARPGRHGDGDGLFLVVKPSGARSWVLRVQADGTRRDVGLGAADMNRSSVKIDQPDPISIPLLHRRLLTLAEAREKSAMLRAAAKAGLNPIAERDRERTAISTFSAVTKTAHEALRSGWSDKAAASFLSSLAQHAFPVLGDMRIDEISAADITKALAPIWTTKPEVARKLRQRIGTVLNFAHGKGLRPTEAPSRSVTVALPRQPRGGNFEAMPYADVPAFVASVREQYLTLGRSALLFQIYTSARPGEVRGARWSQIDFATGEWRRPSELMKGRNAPPHTVTLNQPAIDLLQQVRGNAHRAPDALIFPGRGGARMSDATMRKILRDAGLAFDPHGFRSSFRDWAAENMPEIPDPVAEAALAHTINDRVVAAYKRTVFIEMRRTLLDAWGQFIRTGGAVS